MPKAPANTDKGKVEWWIKHSAVIGQSKTVKELQADIYDDTGKEYSTATVRSALVDLKHNGKYVEHVSRTEWRRIR